MHVQHERPSLLYEGWKVADSGTIAGMDYFLIYLLLSAVTETFHSSGQRLEIQGGGNPGALITFKGD